jgi:PAS domain S-box-containing protein
MRSNGTESDNSGHLAVAPSPATADTDVVDTQTHRDKAARGVTIDVLASELVLSMMLDRTADGVLLTDGEGVIVYASKPLLAMFGYTAEALLGQAVEVLLPEHHRDDHNAHVEQYMSSPTARPMGRPDLDIEGRRADGSSFPIDVQLNSLPGMSLVVATVRDMTEQRHLAVDRAIAGIDLANATDRVKGLQESLDLVVQRLFALGTLIAAGASNETVLRERLVGAIRGIDEVIDAVQQRRRASGF